MMTETGVEENIVQPLHEIFDPDDGISSASRSSDDGSKPAEESEWEDLLGSRELFRKVLKSGTGDAKPTYGDVVTIRANGLLENGQSVDCSGKLIFLVGHSEVIPAFDLCVTSMTVGEIDGVRTTARFAYGKVGKEDEIPADAKLTYEIELLSIEKGPDIYEMSVDQRLAAADKKKRRGNYYFQREEFTQAVDVYSKALNVLELEANETETKDDRQLLLNVCATLYNNLAAAQLKLGAWDAASLSARRCLEAQPENVKALFRKAQALMGKREYSEAISILDQALALESNNLQMQKERRRAISLRRLENENSRAVYKRMFESPASQPDAQWKRYRAWTYAALLLAGSFATAFALRHVFKADS